FHVAFVNSGGTATLYINGVRKAQKASGYSISATGSNFAIGRQFTPFNEFVNGSIDELRVWNVARTVSQIKHAMFAGANPSDPPLVAYYNFNEGTGTTVGNTSSTTGLDGTVQGSSPTWPTSPIQ